MLSVMQIHFKIFMVYQIMNCSVVADSREMFFNLLDRSFCKCYIRDKVEIIEAATPLTVERYTLHPKGSSFGTKFEGLDISMNLHKNLPGLFHAGSVGIIMSGWLGAANYGAIQSNSIESYLGTQNV